MAYFAEKNFFEDPEAFARGQALSEGVLVLDWMEVPTERVVCRSADPKRGLTYGDCNVGSYGYDALPEFIRNNYSMAPRGSCLVPGLPDLGYTENRKSDLWADNVCELYEEAKARRWTPAVDIDWEAVTALEAAPEMKAAMSQLCTALEEIALVVMEFPSRWVFVINQEFLELKSFLCAQMIDQARQVETFRKRGMATGGLKRASADIEQALKELLVTDTYGEGSVGINVMLGSLLLAVYSLMTGASDPDARIFRLCMQDTARSLAYGVGQVRCLLEGQAGGETFLQDYLDRSEHAFVGVAGATELFEPLVVLAGGGTGREQAAEGAKKVHQTFATAVDLYLERLAGAGLERRGRSRLPVFFSAP